MPLLSLRSAHRPTMASIAVAVLCVGCSPQDSTGRLSVPPSGPGSDAEPPSEPCRITIPNVEVLESVAEARLTATSSGDCRGAVEVEYASKTPGRYFEPREVSADAVGFEVPEGQSPHAHLRVGDLDGDGDLDLVASVSTVETGVRWYENEGGRPLRFVSRSLSQVGGDAVFGVQLHDINRDGALDILVGGLRSRIFLNDGRPEPRFDLYVWPDDRARCFLLDVGDLDGDGDLDLLCTGGDASDTDYRWLENDGERWPSFTAREVPATERPIDARIGDLDGDGDLDWVTAHWLGANHDWYRNDGGAPPRFSRQALPTGEFRDPPAMVELTDVNGDGATDILSVSRRSMEDGTLVWYQQDSTRPGVFMRQERPGTFRGAVGRRFDDIADFDGDQDLDFLSARSGLDPVDWFSNDGRVAPTFEPTLVRLHPSQLLDTAVADMDADGDPDVIFWSAGPRSLELYQNQREHLQGPPRASAPSDFSAVSGTLRFEPGDKQRTFTLPIVDDERAEPSEVVFLELRASPNASLGRPRVQVTILDDD